MGDIIQGGGWSVRVSDNIDGVSDIYSQGEETAFAVKFAAVAETLTLSFTNAEEAKKVHDNYLAEMQKEILLDEVDYEDE